MTPDFVLGQLRLTGKDISKYVFMAFATAKFLEPSVIYIDDCEKLFFKSKKKDSGNARKKFL